MRAEERIIVISNRLPVRLRRAGSGWRAEHSSGGLVTAMTPILARSHGIWIGWPGDSAGIGDPKRQAILETWQQESGHIAVDLPPKTAELFYEGYANQTLWPLFHSFPSRLVFDPEGWKAYVEANRAFHDVVARHYRPGDRIWVHDYHLMLLPNLLRNTFPEAEIGFFLHTPFPSSEVFRILPRREELLQGLLGADLLAFQTHSHLQHFRTAMLRILGMESRAHALEVAGRSVRLEALPIGIAPEEFTGLLREGGEARNYLEEYKARFQGQRILLSVDRLDYTKGIPERLRTFRRLLENARHLRGKVALMQVAVPSRGRISSYAQLRQEVNALVGEINGHFATPGWTPVVYMQRGIPRSQLVALYALAEVGWVSPLRDGMNLVAKEFVACKEGGDGALVLSELAGAAAEMGEAFLVNPFDEERTAAVLERALSMSPGERKERMAALYERVVANNVFAWCERFLALLAEASLSRAKMPGDQPAILQTGKIRAAYRQTRNRLLFLDYDGTLTSHVSRPQEAVPSRAVLDLLARLARSPRNCVMIISGRRREDLDHWFGGVAGLWLASEHGAALRPSDSTSWETLYPNMGGEWKSRVRPILEHFVTRTPGSFVEEKEYSLVWHYRMSDPEFGEWLANELAAMLEGLLAETELRAFRGRKNIEIKPLGINKSDVLDRLVRIRGRFDFRFAVGDDRTDEDLFARLDQEAWTVHVGKGHSRARFSLPDPAGVRDLLESLAAAEPEQAKGA